MFAAVKMYAHVFFGRDIAAQTVSMLLFLEDKTSYQQAWHPRIDGRRLRDIEFSSFDYNVCFGNANALPVTTSRAKTYTESLQCHHPRDDRALNIKIKYLAMYFEEIDESIDIEPCNKSPLRMKQEVSNEVSADF
ncbi:hypothetical protein H257_08865 [Aphanomyces astaci]|uniref:Uncharacterized protein n=1 Tax=Aphanomyces astaci TaxID=112090 RepID=W4GEQ4_APHAT|nr:hypothetical protein H257_08865 [Aphanomyces astaci]ETV77448.1 hypothetical protein H257_08865 [Aphanomyces astaci]|eukprot:XP_009833235.1 hypothetical protein H257_08865 [Aphanomyces astaci]